MLRCHKTFCKKLSEFCSETGAFLFFSSAICCRAIPCSFLPLSLRITPLLINFTESNRSIWGHKYYSLQNKSGKSSAATNGFVTMAFFHYCMSDFHVSLHHVMADLLFFSCNRMILLFKQDSEEPSTSLSKNGSGIMIALTVRSAPFRWWVVASSQKGMTSFALNVGRIFNAQTKRQRRSEESRACNI